MARLVADARPLLRGLVVVVSSVLLLACTASSAWAGKGVVGVVGSAGAGDGQFSSAAATAVDLASGDVLVVDPGNFRVERFAADGSFLGAFGWGVADGSATAQTCSSGCLAGLQGNGAGQFDGPQGVAVDSSGSIYVVDGNNARVEKFDPSGNFVSQFGSAGSGDGQLSAPQGIAIGPGGAIYVADAGNNRVDHFDQTGAFVDAFGAGVADGSDTFETCTSGCQAGIPDSGDGAFNFPTRVAVDSTGAVYVLDFFNGRIERFTSADAFDEQFDPTDVNPSTGPVEIAVGPGNDHLYVAQEAPDFSEQRVFEIDPGGTVVDVHGTGSTASNVSGLALNAGSQRIYLADGFNARVFVLDDITPPTLSVDPATGVTTDSASLSGSVTPNGDPSVGWHFETSTDDATWSPVAADQDAGNGNGPVAVSQDLTGLVPNTTYFVRLAGTRPFNAPTFSSEVQFTTGAIPPDAATGAAFDMAPTQATVEGQVNPNHSPTTYSFDYGATTAYGHSAPAAGNGDAGSADSPGPVVQRLSGLQPQTTYHYRVVATNQAGTVRGADQTFTTNAAFSPSVARPGIPGAGFLPNDRGWERVSPSDKNGSDVLVDPQRTRVAADGNAASFASLGAFGDAIGSSVSTDYLSVRDPSGWSSHAITPPQAPLAVKPILAGLQSMYVGPFSSDLSTGVFLASSPVTSDANVAKAVNVYLRNDLTTPGAGSYQLLSGCPLCASSGTPLPPAPTDLVGGAGPLFASASADYGHVLFESQQSLTSDAPSGCSNFFNLSQCPGNLYEWDHGTVRLAGVLPDTACGTPACPAHGSQAGQGAGSFHGASHLTPHTISADGSRIFFTVPTRPRANSGALYMRLNHTTTVQLNASERTTPDPSGPQPATYWDATPDGTRVFFTSAEALTDDAPANGDSKLYVYDASKPDSDPHNLTFLSADGEPADPADVQTVLGTSADGHYVYFSAIGQLVAGEPVLGTAALYVWHDGTVRYITSMSSAADLGEDTTAATWTFHESTARVTPDGLHLLFSLSAGGAGPTGYDQGSCGDLSAGCRELYVYSYETQRLACASCNPTGAPATAGASPVFRPNTNASNTTWTQNQPLSDDGRRVLFSTAEALVPQDVNDVSDVYEYDVPTGTVHLITSGTDHSASYFMNASPSGNDVFFVTREQLTGIDGDNNYDLYDARVDGGFAAPPATQPCSGVACRGPQSQAPAPPSIGSELINGASTHPAVSGRKVHRCRRGFVLKKVHGRTRCVKKRKAHRTRRAKRARSHRRTK